MKEFEFSIIIPVYNVERYLCECIDSILKQENFNSYRVEIILVDDGSTDNSGIFCDNYSEKYDFIKVIHQENQGLLQARRAGFKIASGAYVINLDSDDLLFPNALRLLDDTISQTNSDIIFFNLSLFQDDSFKPYYSDVFTHDTLCTLNKSQIIDSYFCSNNPVVTSMASKAIKLNCIDIDRDYSYFEKLSFGEDTLQTAEVVSNSSSFVYLNESLYAYRIGSGMTANFDPNYYWIFMKILDYVMEYNSFIDVNFDMSLYYEKVLYTACRAIIQSKFAHNFSYSDRKSFIVSIYEDCAFSKAIKSIDLNKTSLSKKHKLLIELIKYRMYFLIHIVMKILK